MILPDVNVLLQAFRSDTPRHDLCKAWLDGVVRAEARFGIAPLVLGSVVRITTNPRVFKTPSPLDDALGFCEDLLGQPHCEAVTPGERHWPIFRSLCVEAGLRGNDVSDAWLAALAIEWGCEWMTLDRGFSRFPGLKWSEPAAPLA